VVDRVVDAGVARERIVLLGFSQGACLAAEFVRRHPSRYGGLVVFSGGLIGPPGTVWSPAGSLDAMPVFLGCSDIDSHIPKLRVEESAAAFTELGASVSMRLYAGMGHLVNDDEIAQARAIIQGARS
jgi:predicted esterase